MLYQMFASRLSNFFSRRSQDHSPSFKAAWEDRKEHIEQIQKWLMESADTFIVVQGPRGSGKRELVVEQALKEKKLKLVIDCKKIQDARGESSTIDAAAMSVGYTPVFSWMNSMSGLIDLAAQGAAGIKTGFSETLDSQLSKIFTSTTGALRQLALDNRNKKQEKDANLSDDDWLEAHPEKRPVVVIDNFLHKANESNVVYDKLAQWAADLTSANIAHVIFLTTDVSFSKSLSKALPDRVFRQLSLSDLPTDAAKRFVLSHLDAEPEEVDMDGKKVRLTASQRRKDLTELDTVCPALGGRLTDLEFLSRRIKAGETPSKAVDEIIEQSASEIIKMYLFAGGGDADREWSPQQAWVLIKSFADQSHAVAATDSDPAGDAAATAAGNSDRNGVCLRYNEMLLHHAFASAQPAPDLVLASLEQAELISIVSANGRPQGIKPGKPVFLPAFCRLAADRVLRSRLDMVVLGEQIKRENETIERSENELRLLGGLPRQPEELKGRVRYLLRKVEGCQGRLEGWEREMAQRRRVVCSEF